MKPDFLAKLASQISDNLPKQVTTLKKDFEKNCKRVLQASFDKLDLVTRKEFDLQSKVLQRTRKKLDEMETYIKELETKIKSKQRK